MPVEEKVEGEAADKKSPAGAADQAKSEPTKSPATSQETDKADETVDNGEEDLQDDDGGADDDDEVFTVTAEDLTAIKADPRLKRVYKNLSRAATKKFQAIARDSEVLEQIRANPLEAAKAIAAHVGLRVVEDQKPEKETKAVEDAITAKIAKLYGEEYAADVRSVIEEVSRSVVASAVAPLQARAEELTRNVLDSSSESEIQAFKASMKGAVTPEVEKRMTELTYEIAAGERSTPQAYLKRLYQIASSELGGKKATAQVADRIKKAAEEQEPSRAASESKVAADRAEQLKGLSFDEMLEKAFEMASTEHRGTA